MQCSYEYIKEVLQNGGSVRRGIGCELILEGDAIVQIRKYANPARIVITPDTAIQWMDFTIETKELSDIRKKHSMLLSELTELERQYTAICGLRLR